MPKNPRVQSGNVTIEGKGTDHLKYSKKRINLLLIGIVFLFIKGEE